MLYFVLLYTFIYLLFNTFSLSTLLSKTNL